MPDWTAMQSLLTGAGGGLLVLAGQYVVARLSESHKAALAAIAKKREQSHRAADGDNSRGLRATE